PGQHQPLPAIEETPSQDIVTDKGPQAMAERAQDRGPATAGVSAAGSLGGIAIDLVDEHFQAGIGIVQKMPPLQNRRTALDLDMFMHPGLGKPARFSPEQT